MRVIEDCVFTIPPLIHTQTIESLLEDKKGKRLTLSLDQEGGINEDVGYLYRASNFFIEARIAARISYSGPEEWEMVTVTNNAEIEHQIFDLHDFIKRRAEISGRLNPKNVDNAVMYFITPDVNSTLVC